MSLAGMHSAEAQKIWADLKPVESEGGSKPDEAAASTDGAAASSAVRAEPKEVAPAVAPAAPTAPTAPAAPAAAPRAAAAPAAPAVAVARAAAPAAAAAGGASTCIRGSLHSQLGKGSFFGKPRWHRGHWSFDRRARLLSQFADGGERDASATFSFAPDCDLRLSSTDPRLAIVLTAVVKRGTGATTFFGGGGGDEAPQPLTLKATTVAECNAWRLALEAALRPATRTSPAAASAAAAGARGAAGAARADSPPPAPPPLAKSPKSSAITKLAALAATFAELEGLVGGIEAGLAAGEGGAWKAASRSRVAQINGRLDKLQFAGIDSVVTTDIKDDAKKTECKVKRKALNRDVEALRARIVAAHVALRD